MVWHRLRNIEQPWGDYGNMLYAGMVTRRDDDGLVGIERVGPFVPPLYVGGRSVLIATNDARTFLERTGLTGFEMRPAVKKRIVRIDWRGWDLGAEEPERFPAKNEPENYVLGRKHNPDIAEAMGRLWEAHVSGIIGDDTTTDFVRTAATEYSGFLVASDKARDVLLAEYGAWLRFEAHDS
jgi:hypothetical protein